MCVWHKVQKILTTSLVEPRLSVFSCVHTLGSAAAGKLRGIRTACPQSRHVLRIIDALDPAPLKRLQPPGHAAGIGGFGGFLAAPGGLAFEMTGPRSAAAAAPPAGLGARAPAGVKT